MAKEIKAIQCPKCGSTEKTEIRSDFYRCSSCQTEYFLDDNDINVNVNQTVSYSQTPMDTAKVKRGLIIFIGIFFGMIIFTSGLKFFTENNNSSIKSFSNSDDGFWEGGDVYCFAEPSMASPCLLQIGRKGFRGSNNVKGGTYITFYDVEKKEAIRTEKINDKTNGFAEVRMRRFADGFVYATVDKTKVFKIDIHTLAITDVSADLFKGLAPLSVGVATMELVYNDYGDGLNIMTNDGKNYYYYPVSGKLYTKEEFEKQRVGISTLLSGAKERYTYLFTSESSDYPDEKTQLLKVLFKDNVGGPKEMITTSSWKKVDVTEYPEGAGIYYGVKTKYKKKLTHNGGDRVLSLQDITPGRSYFNPNILYSDDSGELIIKVFPSADPDALPNIQSINTNTGAINWTYMVKRADVFKSKISICRYKEGFLLLLYRNMLMLDKSGKEKAFYELPQ